MGDTFAHFFDLKIEFQLAYNFKVFFSKNKAHRPTAGPIAKKEKRYCVSMYFEI
jgi:hypothetical protein